MDSMAFTGLKKKPHRFINPYGFCDESNAGSGHVPAVPAGTLALIYARTNS